MDRVPGGFPRNQNQNRKADQGAAVLALAVPVEVEDREAEGVGRMGAVPAKGQVPAPAARQVVARRAGVEAAGPVVVEKEAEKDQARPLAGVAVNRVVAAKRVIPMDRAGAHQRSAIMSPTSKPIVER